jgi:phosphoglycerol transferase MdoB-like AlkP superfamily enzyme
MRAGSLTAVLVLAKSLGVVERDLPPTPWLPAVLFWDDVAVGCAFWLADRWLGRPRPLWVAYWTLVAWAAVNVPVVRALASPLTTTMMGAAGGPLFDSIVHYATWANLAAVAGVLAAAAVLPRALARIRPRVRVLAAVGALVLAAPGPILSDRLDIRGLQRNALTAVATTALPRIETRAAARDWRASPFGPAEQGGPSPLNGAAAGHHVVLIVLESTGAGYLRPYGAADDPMPNLTAFARRALRVERAFAVYPESVKGLFATLCSRAPAFDVPVAAHARATCASLTAALSHAGYRTALFHSGRFGYLGMDAILAAQRFDTLEDAGAIGGHVESSFGVDEPSAVSRILAWIDGLEQDRPFFVTYLPAAGHHPYATNEPGPFSGRGDLSDYLNALHEGDRSLGSLFEGLRARNLDRRTVFVIVGDHGEAFGQHDGNYGHSLAIYDENVRVPLLIAMPGVDVAQARVGNVASILDIAPTVLDLVGLPIPADYEGASVFVPGERMALFHTDYSVGLLGLQDRCWKYQFEVETGRSRLFDTCVDPREAVDLADRESNRVRAYRARLEQWSSATRSSILDSR